MSLPTKPTDSEIAYVLDPLVRHTGYRFHAYRNDTLLFETRKVTHGDLDKNINAIIDAITAHKTDPFVGALLANVPSVGLM